MNKTTLSFTVVLLVLGLFISMQFKTQQEIRDALTYQDAATLVTINRTMQAREAELLETLQELRQGRYEIAFQLISNEELIYQTQREIEQLKILNGEVPVSGPGITVTITRDSNLYYLDLLDLVNELWGSVAEAIAINDHRITINTHIQEYSPGEILVNNEPLLFPIVVTAIGNSNDLQTGLTLPGGLVDGWSWRGISPTIVARDRVTIPAINIQETVHRF